MAEQVAEIDTLFLHEHRDDYLVTAYRDGDRLFHAILELKQTEAGPRPARFRIKRDSSEDLRDPDQFITLARGATNVHISEQTTPAAVTELREMLDGYQVSADVVRTCRVCAKNARYSPITAKTHVSYGDDELCFDCASRELDRELAFRGGLTRGAKRRLKDLLLEVQDLDRILNLVAGQLDPELTKFDEISATVDDVNPVQVADLDVDPAFKQTLADRFDQLLPVQNISIRNGLLEGANQLVVSATATGKTLIGELTGINRVCRGDGKLLYLVPLVALANQKHEDFKRTYGDLVDVTIRVGSNRIRGGNTAFTPTADVIVGTYEGIDHALRTGRDLGMIGTVVIDEVHTLTAEERGHRLDGLISRLKYYCGSQDSQAHHRTKTQWIYLSATVGNPEYLANSLGATLIEFEDRPVPIERHVAFSTRDEKVSVSNRLVKREFDRTSPQGYRGQTIIFTNSRRRCHEISRRLEYSSAPYHAGLEYSRRKLIEHRFADQELAAVVTTAALASGVDFPASQVIFDSLAMGIEWLTVQAFHQMLGRAGRPDYHDRGIVYLLVEPDGVYHHGMDRTEDEAAFSLLQDEMDDVVLEYDENGSIEETLANITVAGEDAKRLNDQMVGSVDTTRAIAQLLDYGFIEGLSPTPVGRIVTTHFLSPDAAFVIRDAVASGVAPYDIVADIELLDAND